MGLKRGNAGHSRYFEMNNLLRCVRIAAFLVLTFAASSVAAQTPSPETGTKAKPAVDGVNVKASPFFFHEDAENIEGANGSIAVPLGQEFGLQIDGLAASDFHKNNDISAYGTAAHLFWRDPSRGLLGVYGGYAKLNSPWDVSYHAAAAEGELYLDRFSVGGSPG